MRRSLLVLIVVFLAVGAWMLTGVRALDREHDQLPAPESKVSLIGYQSESDWILQETAADLAEMAAAATAAPAPVLPVSLPPGLTPWHTEAFVPLVRRWLGGAVDAASEPLDIHEWLIRLTARTVVEADRAASKALAANMRNAAAHDAAALTLGAFALREAPCHCVGDVRWALNRMTAHIAFGDALRDGGGPTADGQLARIIHLALAGRHAKALEGLAALQAQAPASEPMQAWTRALRMRLTQDWRLLEHPARASRLEKLEYFRARRATISERASLDRSAIAENMAVDLTRVVETHNWGVEDGNEFVEPALDLEKEEISIVHTLVRGQPLTAPWGRLNDRATRLITDAGPQVIPWGAWAEFFQRHVAVYVIQIDRLYRVMQARPEVADTTNKALDVELGALRLYPLAVTSRTAGPKGSAADMTLINEAVRTVAQFPELVNFQAWLNVERLAAYRNLQHLVVASTAWFAAPSPQVPYEAGLRSRGSLTGVSRDALLAEAVSDRELISLALAPSLPDQPTLPRARALMEARLDYDVVAYERLWPVATSDAERMELQRRNCAFNAPGCLGLARLMVRAGDEVGGALLYDRVLKDRRVDAVSRANNSRWLVSYYYKEKRIDDALKLALDLAEVGSYTGYISLAYLFERLGRLDDAESVYEIARERYPNSVEHLAFYYRQGITAGKPDFKVKWVSEGKAVFPVGLRPAPTSMPAPPTTGAIIRSDTEVSRRAGVKTGDIIVGLDGWSVDTEAQLRAINGFRRGDNRLKLTLWRDGLFTAEMLVLERQYDLELRDYVPPAS